MYQDLTKFLQEDLLLRHNKRSGKFTVTINGVDKTEKSIDEIVNVIYAALPNYKNNSNWQLFKAMAEKDFSSAMELFENMQKILKDHATSLLSAKSTITSRMQSNIVASPFNSFVKDLGEMPKFGFNEVDKLILSSVRYCNADNCVYVKKNGRLKLIGKLESLKKNPTAEGLCMFIREEIGAKFNEGTPLQIDHYVSKCFTNITNLRHYIISETKQRLDAGEKFEDIELDVMGEKVKISSKCFSEDINALENAANVISLDTLWKIVPTSIFTAKIVKLIAIYNTYELPGGNGNTYKTNEFVKYTYDVVRSGEALTEATYLKNIFTVYEAELRGNKNFSIDEVPNTYTDGDDEALFKYSDETLKRNIPTDSYTKIDDCENLRVLKSWMNEDEFRFTMAWAYAAVHPKTVVTNIALLLWTGGGTYKSSLVKMIKYAMTMASDAREEDLYFEIKGDKFTSDDKNWIPEGQIGLPKAALINVDEATTACIEMYKNFSGSVDKNILTMRGLYENAISYDVRGKFIFTTNKGLQLTSDDGSLLRRVAVIKHASIQNVGGGKGITNDKIVMEYKKQVPLMLSIGKKAYEEIMSMGFSSIDEYAMNCPNITKNLKESTSTSVNTEIYSKVYEMIAADYENDSRFDKDEIRIQGGALKHYYEDACNVEGEDSKYFGNFKKFILEQPSMFVKENEKKASRNFIKAMQDGTPIREIEKNVCSCIFLLHPLVKMQSSEDEVEEPDDVAMFPSKMTKKSSAYDVPGDFNKKVAELQHVHPET